MLECLRYNSLDCFTNKTYWDAQSAPSNSLLGVWINCILSDLFAKGAGVTMVQRFRPSCSCAALHSVVTTTRQAFAYVPRSFQERVNFCLSCGLKLSCIANPAIANRKPCFRAVWVSPDSCETQISVDYLMIYVQDGQNQSQLCTALAANAQDERFELHASGTFLMSPSLLG